MSAALKERLKRNEIIVIGYDKIREFYYKYLISDERLIKNKFKKRLRREVELEDPTKFNDKLQWLKLN